MNEAARFILCLGAAAGVHAVALPGEQAGAGGGGAGVGGAHSVSVIASDGTVAALVERWQAAPQIETSLQTPAEATTEPSTDPALPPSMPSGTQPAMTLPSADLSAQTADRAPQPAAPPPLRHFAALPTIPTPEAAMMPSAGPDLPVLPRSALSQPLTFPGIAAGVSGQAVPEQPTEPESPPAAVPPVPPLPPSAVSSPLAMPAPASPVSPDAADALPRIGTPPTPVTSQPPLERVPFPPRRPQRAIVTRPAPQTAQSPAPAAPSPPAAEEPSPASAPALAARGAGGGAQAGNGGAPAAGDANARQSAMASWGAQIRARIDRRAQRQRGRGSVVLALRVTSGGALASVSVAQGSGQPALDAAALAAARAAGPFPRAPDALGGGTHRFSLTLQFRR